MKHFKKLYEIYQQCGQAFLGLSAWVQASGFGCSPSGFRMAQPGSYLAAAPHFPPVFASRRAIVHVQAVKPFCLNQH